MFNLCVEGVLDFKLEGNTVLNNYSSSGTSGVFYVHDWKQGNDGDTQTATITLGKDVVLNNAPTGGTKAVFVYDTEGANPATIVDNGATWQVSEKWAEKGFSFGTHVDNIIAFKDAEGNLYNPEAIIITGDVRSFKSIASTGTMIENGIGASIRTTSPDGIRFTTKVNKDAYEMLGDAAQFGAIVTTKEVLDAYGCDFSALDPRFAVTTSKNLNWAEEGEKFYTVLTGIGTADYETVYAFTSFVTINYADGTEVTIYANYGEGANARSIYYVASEALKDTRYTYTKAQLAYLNSIVDAVEAAPAN